MEKLLTFDDVIAADSCLYLNKKIYCCFSFFISKKINYDLRFRFKYNNYNDWFYLV